VIFELSEFRAYDIFNEIATSGKNLQRRLNKENFYKDHEEKDEGPYIDDRAIFCFFKKQYQPETLEGDIHDSECKFLVKIMDSRNIGKVSYEE
jgi:hypothetical protein